MKELLKPATIVLILISFTFNNFADETVEKPKVVNEKCPITDKAVSPKYRAEYEGDVYGFCSEDCRTKFKKDRADSLYEQIGGMAAVNAAVDLFYTKVMADERVNFFFDDVNMKRQHNKQKAFIAAALGGPKPWEGKDMRKVHSGLDIKESEFNVIAEHLQKALEELKVKRELVEKVMVVVGSTKDAVLNRDKPTE